jgi:uncharacterized protein
MLKTYFILYVKDQAKSVSFYTHALNQEPSLNVPGMCEFHLSNNCILGLMPQTAIKRLVGENLPDPNAGDGIPRAELYLLVDEPQTYHRRALDVGAVELSGLTVRDWGHRAAYSLDPDGHVLAFAELVESTGAA